MSSAVTARLSGGAHITLSFSVKSYVSWSAETVGGADARSGTGVSPPWAASTCL